MRRLALFLVSILSIAGGVWITVVILAGTGYPVEFLDPSPVQPVAYPHERHVALGMECVTCHIGATEGKHAGIPPTVFCAGCHLASLTAEDEPQAQEPVLAAPTPEPMKRYLTGNEEIPWLQFQLAPRHVFFSHRRHVSIAGLECTVCHGDMSRRALPVTEPDFPRRLWGMNRCVECHLEEEVSTDCLACHH